MATNIFFNVEDCIGNPFTASQNSIESSYKRYRIYLTPTAEPLAYSDATVMNNNTYALVDATGSVYFNNVAPQYYYIQATNGTYKHKAFLINVPETSGSTVNGNTLIVVPSSNNSYPNSSSVTYPITVSDSRYVLVGGAGDGTTLITASTYQITSSVASAKSASNFFITSDGSGCSLVVTQSSNYTSSVLGDSIAKFGIGKAHTAGFQTTILKVGYLSGSNTFPVVGIGEDAFRGYVNDDNFKPWGGLDISYGGAPGTLLLGADVNGTTRTNNTTKVADISMAPYSASQLPITLLESLAENNTSSILNVGGGQWSQQGMTAINFWTTPNVNTRMGVSRMTITPSGSVGINTTNPVNKLDVVGNISCSVITASLLGTASFALNAGGTTLTTASTYPITSSWALNAISTSYTSITTSSYADFAPVLFANIRVIDGNLLIRSDDTGNWYNLGVFDDGSGSYTTQLTLTSATGSIFNSSSMATSMFATTSLSSSWSSQSLSASWSPNQGATTLVTASTYQITSSNSVSSSFARTASYALNAGTGGTTLVTASTYQITSSRAITASYALNGGTGGTTLVTASTYPITSSWSQTASFAINCISQSASTLMLWIPTSSITMGAVGFETASSTTFVISQQSSSTGGISLRTSGSQRMYLTTDGNIQFTGSVSISGSLNATASYANTSATASYSNGFIINGYLQQGNGTVANTDWQYPSHAEGYNTVASGGKSHAEGDGAQSIGEASHAEGGDTIAYEWCSHAEGMATIASGSFQHAEGKWNTHGNTTSLLVIGNGTDDNARADLALFNPESITFNQPLTCSVNIKATSLVLFNPTTATYYAISISGSIGEEQLTISTI